MRDACLLSRRSEDVSIFLEERVFIVKTIGLLVPLRIARGGLLNSLVVAETRRRKAAFNF
jgi:hypothetical protein